MMTRERRAGSVLWLALLAPAACAADGPLAKDSHGVPATSLTAGQLAQAAGARAGDLSNFTTRGWPEAGVAVAWAVATDGGEVQPWLLAQPVAAPARAVRLAAGREVSLLAWLDLQGAPTVIDLLRPPANPESVQPAAAGAPLRPAALLRIRHKLDSGERRTTLMLVALGAAPAAVWREVEASQQSGGGGYRSHQLALKPAVSGAALMLELNQTTLPGAGAQPQMPGPPLTLRFSFDGTTYQRARP